MNSNEVQGVLSLNKHFIFSKKVFENLKKGKDTTCASYDILQM